MTSDTNAALAGLKVLLVDDEMLVSMLLEDMLADLGCEVVGTASRVAQALQMVEGAQDGLDLAILDVNVAGESIAPVAEALAARGVPFIFATGYGESGVPEAWRGRPTLQKPFSLLDVEKTAKAAAAGGSGVERGGALESRSEGS